MKKATLKTTTLRQANKIMRMLEDVPVEQVQKLLAEGYFSDLLIANTEEMVRGDFRKICGLASKFIFASAPFDPTTFEGLGQDWSEVAEDRDERAYSLLEVDLAKVIFDSYIGKGEEKLRRLKASKDIRWGATQFAGLWKGYLVNGKNSVLERAYQAKIITGYLDFFGNVLLGPHGNRYVLCLFRSDDGEWDWGVSCLKNYWSVSRLSASASQV
jgi:hypothetical protein